jgi:transposase
VNRRTWAPRGCTPQQRSWDRRDRLSVIGVVTLPPNRSRVGSYFDVQRENVRTGDVVDFLRRLRQKIRRPIIVVWDRWNVHRSAAKHIAQKRWKGVSFELLPAYAPELNPVEAMWSHAKYAKLANYVPDDADALDAAVRNSLSLQSRNQQLKRSYFKTAQLRL